MAVNLYANALKKRSSPSQKSTSQRTNPNAWTRQVMARNTRRAIPNPPKATTGAAATGRLKTQQQNLHPEKQRVRPDNGKTAGAISAKPIRRKVR